MKTQFSFLALAACCLWGLAAPLARAHHGFDCGSEIRLLDGQTRLVMRMSPQVASALLADEAPGEWDDASFSRLEAKLAELAKTFITIRGGGKELKAVSSRVVRELQGEFAFVLSYPAARELPLSVSAEFCKTLGPSFQGSLAVRGLPSRPVERAGPLLAKMELSPTRRELVLTSLDKPLVEKNPAE